MDVTYFESAADLRRWLADNAATADELWLGFHKVGSGHQSVTWAEVVDEVLCVGWIDGIRKTVDETRWTIRLTPRRPRSIWSQVNIKRYAELDAERRFPVPGVRVADPKACQCGEVLKGVIKPWECKVFGTACTPERPIGTCMVSSEGACAAYYNFGRFAREREVV